MNQKKLLAVFIKVSNLEQSIAFYCDVLGLTLREIEQWENGRGANIIISDHSPLLTLIESDKVSALEYPPFNLNCSNVIDIHNHLKEQGYKTGKINRWASENNDHIDFDVYDPDEHPINLIEVSRRNKILDGSEKPPITMDNLRSEPAQI